MVVKVVFFKWRKKIVNFDKKIMNLKNNMIFYSLFVFNLPQKCIQYSIQFDLLKIWQLIFEDIFAKFAEQENRMKKAPIMVVILLNWAIILEMWFAKAARLILSVSGEIQSVTWPLWPAPTGHRALPDPELNRENAPDSPPLRANIRPRSALQFRPKSRDKPLTGFSYLTPRSHRLQNTERLQLWVRAIKKQM